MRAAKKVVVLTAPSGSGKTTIARRILKAHPSMCFSVSVTTRPPRPCEQDGVDYHFVSEEQFRAYVAAGELLEYEEVYPGLFYGTLRAEVERAAHIAPVLLDIDVRGAMNVKQAFGDAALTIFIRPPSLGVLATRLQRRGTESEVTRQGRLQHAVAEMDFADRCDAVVVNDDLEQATEETLHLVCSFLDS